MGIASARQFPHRAPAGRRVKLKANHFDPNHCLMAAPLLRTKWGWICLARLGGAGFISLLAWLWVQWRRQTLLDKKLARLVAVSDVRTDERLGYDLTRAVTIGDIIRELPPVGDKRGMRTD
jgi:hypothetical protein